MTEIVTPPPPPPPPPPSPSDAKASFDFVKPFAFVFEDARWLNKVLIGGLFQLLAMMLIGIPFLLGYLAKMIRNVIAGDPLPLPEWDDLGEKFTEGLRLVGVGFVYILPLFVLIGIFVIPAAILGTISQHTNSDFDPAGCVVAGMWCLIFPISLAYMFWMPAAMLHAVVEQRFGAAFEFGRIKNFIVDNIGNYLLSIVILFVARVAASLGLILFCIGIVFTAFWGMLVTFYAFAQTWRLAQQK